MGEAARRKAAGNTKPKGKAWKANCGLTRRGQEWNLSSKMRVLVAMPAGKKAQKEAALRNRNMERMQARHRSLMR